MSAIEEHFLDLSEIKGQETAKRALEVAAAGGHNILMMGPPGSGKSMLAARLPGLLPPLTPREALEVTTIHSIAGLLTDSTLIRSRPFRDPHHSASLPALVGGGAKANPGEVSLAHQGVLFLDELPEFSRATLESLRQPLESGRVSIARANAHVHYPARVQLVAAMNPCKCGYLGDPGKGCSKAPRCGQDYQNKISGPLFDRIDIHVDVEAVLAQDLHGPRNGESSESIRKRVMKAREIQLNRYMTLDPTGSITTNAQADGKILDIVATPDEAGQKLLESASRKMGLSARSYHRILRVARTLADLEGVEVITAPHISEALSYRRLHGGE
jgi:magnesium chelatase family protein